MEYLSSSGIRVLRNCHTTDVAQEQPKKESFLKRFFNKNNKPFNVPELPKYSVEWYLLPKPENRKELVKQLPYDLAYFVPRNGNSPIAPGVGKEIRDYLSLYSVDWYLLPKQENRIALRYILPKDLADKVPEDCNEPIDPTVEKLIREHFTVIEKKHRPSHFWYLDF